MLGRWFSNAALQHWAVNKPSLQTQALREMVSEAVAELGLSRADWRYGALPGCGRDGGLLIDLSFPRRGFSCQALARDGAAESVIGSVRPSLPGQRVPGHRAGFRRAGLAEAAVEKVVAGVRGEHQAGAVGIVQAMAMISLASSGPNSSAGGFPAIAPVVDAAIRLAS